MERFLANTSRIDLSRQKHGAPGNRQLDYEPSYIIRGLLQMHLELTPK